MYISLLNFFCCQFHIMYSVYRSAKVPWTPSSKQMRKLAIDSMIAVMMIMFGPSEHILLASSKSFNCISYRVSYNFAHFVALPREKFSFFLNHFFRSFSLRVVLQFKPILVKYIMNSATKTLF